MSKAIIYFDFISGFVMLGFCLYVFMIERNLFLNNKIFFEVLIIAIVALMVLITFLYKRRTELLVNMNIVFFTIIIMLVFLEIACHLLPDLIPNSVVVHTNHRIVEKRAKDNDGSDFVVRGMMGLHHAGQIVRYPLISEFSGGDSKGKDVQSITINVKMDEMGFRNPMGIYSFQELDVVVLGDSYAHGLGVQNNWSDYLRENMSPKVLNLSSAGGAPQHWVDYLKYVFNEKKPIQLIIVSHWDNNDYNDAIRYESVKSNGGNFADYWNTQGFYATDEIKDPLHRFLAENSVLFAVIKALKYCDLLNTVGDDRIYDVLLDDGKTSVSMRFRRSVPNLRENIEGARLTLESLSRLKEAAEKNGTKVMLVYFSTNSNLYYDNILDKDEYIEQNMNNYQRIRDMLEDYCGKNGIEFLDMTENLKRYAGSRPILQIHHFTEPGHKAIGYEIARFIKERNLQR